MLGENLPYSARIRYEEDVHGNQLLIDECKVPKHINEKQVSFLLRRMRLAALIFVQEREAQGEIIKGIECRLNCRLNSGSKSWAIYTPTHLVENSPLFKQSTQAQRPQTVEVLQGQFDHIIGIDPTSKTQPNYFNGVY